MALGLKKLRAKKKAAEKKTVAKKAPAKKTAKPAAKKVVKKAAPKKAAAKKAAPKKAAAKKPVAKKAAAKKPVAKKTAAKKTVAKKAAVKKTTAKKTVAKKAAPKAAAKKAAAKKTEAKTAAPKKAAAKKTAAKKTAAKKPAAKKKAVKKTPKKKMTARETARAEKEAALARGPAKNSPNGKKRRIMKARPLATEQKKAPAPKKVVASKKPLPKQKDGFKIKDFVVYPTHGVGQIVDIEESEVAGIPLQLFVIFFDQEKMTLRVPLAKAQATGMRPLSSTKVVAESLTILKGRARIKRTMWSRRAQEYEAKINSGSIEFISEVVRDLYRAEGQPEQSYSERQLYEQALDRLTREVAAVEKLDYEGGLARVEKSLRKDPPKAANDEADGDGDATDGEAEQTAAE